MMGQNLLKVGTRRSPLALLQAEEVRDRLLATHIGLSVEIVDFSTTGDRIQDRTLAAIGGKGLFTKEIEHALYDGTIDLAVHSAKDMLTELPQGLVLGPVLKREDARDVLISRDVEKLEALPPGAIVGTASLRRQAQVLACRPDLKVVPFRGNVQTRLRKLNEGRVDATLLALAGLKRLKKSEIVTEIIDTRVLLPAVGQGAIALELREGDVNTLQLCTPLNDETTAAEILSERAMLRVLDGSCRTPIAGFAVAEKGELYLRALVARPDGSEVIRTERRGGVCDAVELGRDAGQELKQSAGSDFMS
ncbi:MAG: Porphobilinogen deaminase [Alphaproteobacteria bacterium MarineAlpha4_Bin2]|nr:MAG: Porphobilinogen deaminase [Alphaproteobacteria bacterium MarineAlpha4_Bin2]